MTNPGVTLRKRQLLIELFTALTTLLVNEFDASGVNRFSQEANAFESEVSNERSLASNKSQQEIIIQISELLADVLIAPDNQGNFPRERLQRLSLQSSKILTDLLEIPLDYGGVSSESRHKIARNISIILTEIIS
ncbi:MAG TPA: hypothetical protein DDW76_00875 [Cyanobacteria bacterium UBA11369]|nr:hypothetical protein [Cyanobacteria bacterium UBA11371]HBE21102.1 hypothetical protein [Cyanobacteria bacterium UBA11367]HBE36527.1 hypothetical protein [Cyanobacteria bacterium UBA11368]HBE47388.1 hypothetical protein [Cyanobacteria bacterium UBA11369]